MDIGITEFDFWEMTIGEVVRRADSYNRTHKLKMQEKASFDYVQATLIVKGVGICLGSKETFPSLEEAYATAFKDEIEQREKQEAEQRE